MATYTACIPVINFQYSTPYSYSNKNENVIKLLNYLLAQCTLVPPRFAIWVYPKCYSLKQKSGHRSNSQGANKKLWKATSAVDTTVIMYRYSYGALMPRRQILSADDKLTPASLDALGVPRPHHQLILLLDHLIFLVIFRTQNLNFCPLYRTCSRKLA